MALPGTCRACTDVIRGPSNVTNHTQGLRCLEYFVDDLLYAVTCMQLFVFCAGSCAEMQQPHTTSHTHLSGGLQVGVLYRPIIEYRASPHKQQSIVVDLKRCQDPDTQFAHFLNATCRSPKTGVLYSFVDVQFAAFICCQEAPRNVASEMHWTAPDIFLCGVCPLSTEVCV